MPSTELNVCDLHTEVAEKTFYKIFQAFWLVQSIRVCRNLATHRSLGYTYSNYFSSLLDKNKSLRIM